MVKTITNALLLTSLLLAGCTADETTDANAGRSPMELTTPLTIESASLDAELMTRATSSTITSGSIGVFLSGADYVAVNNSQYTNGGSGWSPAGAGINLGAKDAQVCAYYPWVSTYNNSTAIPLTSQVYDAAKDLSYAVNQTKNGTSSSASAIAFNMVKAYARLKIQFKRADYPGTCVVSKVTLKNLLPNATLNITNGAYSASTGTLGSELVRMANVAVGTGSTATVWADYLLVPCRPAETGMVVSLVVDGKPMTTTVPWSGGYSPAAGAYVAITLTIKGTSLGGISVTKEDWPSATDGGEHTPLPVP